MDSEQKIMDWVKEMLVAFAATTLSIILTFGSTMIYERIEQKQERKLTALMVMSSIEDFARTLDEYEKDQAHVDSIATLLLSLSLEDVAKLGDEHLKKAIDETAALSFLTHDQTAEPIFSSNIDTWKNMGNFRFIDNVGDCFASMNGMEAYYNAELEKFHAARIAIYDHPNDYPGTSMAEKCLRNEDFRLQLAAPRFSRRWLSYCAEAIREVNRKNMHLIGISEEEVMAFSDDRDIQDVYEEKQVQFLDFETPQINRDSLAGKMPLAREIDSVLHVK